MARWGGGGGEFWWETRSTVVQYMGLPSCMRSVVDRNFVMPRMTAETEVEWVMEIMFIQIIKKESSYTLLITQYTLQRKVICSSCNANNFT